MVRLSGSIATMPYFGNKQRRRSFFCTPSEDLDVIFFGRNPCSKATYRGVRSSHCSIETAGDVSVGIGTGLIANCFWHELTGADGVDQTSPPQHRACNRGKHQAKAGAGPDDSCR
jgi:hypothetical protein